MCGIAGLLLGGGVDSSLLAAMAAAMVHRGPDQAGLWLSPDRTVGLAHRRLSILDLDPKAGQPMVNEDGRVVVVFNGEIYNHASLRAELLAAGHRFATDHSDTEVLVHGYEQWGLDGLLTRLSGMFAFALWDGGRRRLMLARDWTGIKPLYFTRTGGAFLFASEIKGLLAHPGVRREVCGPAFWHMLSFLTAPAPLTLFEGIFKLPAGWLMEVDEAGALSARRWRMPAPGLAVPEEPVAGIRRRLEAAVASHMAADVPVGAFLSGGIDSSAIVALMSRAGGARVHSFSVGFSDHTHLNELEWADRVARHFGTEHHEVRVSGADMEGYLEQLVHSQDEPIADWVCIPLHFVSQLAARSGVKVVMVGEGSDELFCGYGSWMKWLRLHRSYWTPWRRYAPLPLRRLAAWAGARAEALRPALGAPADILRRACLPEGELFWGGAVSLWEGGKRHLCPDAVPFTGSAMAAELVAAGILPASWLEADSHAVPGTLLGRFDHAHPGAGQLTRMTHLDLSLRLPELLLMRVDKITMAQSLEARVPFLDRALVEFAMAIPDDLKVAGGAKALLKQAVRGLIPDDVIDRPKRGFGAPMAEWLRGEFGRRVKADILASPLVARFGFDRAALAAMADDHRAGRRDCSLPLWVLYNAVAWHNHWIGG